MTRRRRRFLQRFARRALVLDLVAQIADGFLGLLAGDVGLDFGRDLGERLDRFRRRLGHFGDGIAELAFDGIADAADGQGEDGVREGLVENAVLRHDAEVRDRQFRFRGDVGQFGAALDLFARRIGALVVLEHDLTSLPGRFGFVALVLDGVVARLRGGVGDRRGIGELRWFDRQGDDAAIFRRAETFLAAVVEGLKSGVVRSRGLASRGRRQFEIFDAAGLVAEAVDGVESGVRHGHVAGQRVGNLLPQVAAALDPDETLLAIAVVLKQLAELARVELARRPREFRLGQQPLRDVLVGNRQPQLLRLRIQRGV